MTRPECLLHIGHTKTGSTSIQNCLGRHRPELARKGVCYPESPGRTNHALVPASVTHPGQVTAGVHPGFWRGEEPAARIARFPAEFEAEMAALPETCRLVVLSSEQAIHMLPDAESLGRLKAFLSPYFSRIRVVIYLRRQDQHYASAYTQRLRDGVIAPPTLPEPGSPEATFYDYAALLRTWADTFGTEAIEPRLFQRSELVNGDVIDDFLTLCGAEGTVPPDDPDRGSNTSTDQIGQALMYAVGRDMTAALPRNKPGLGDPVWRHFADLLDRLRAGRGWLPEAEAARAFVERYGAGNEWIRATWFPDRAHLFETTFRETGQAGFPEGADLLPHMTDLVARLVQRSLEEDIRHYQEGADLLARHGDRQGALVMLQKALRLDESLPSTRLQLAIVLFQLNQRKEAVLHFDAAAERLGEDHKTIRWVRETFVVPRIDPPRKGTGT